MTMKIFENKFILFVLRLIIGGIFIYASIGKLFNPVEFGSAIRSYDMLPLFSIGFLSVIIPFIEFLCGLFLILGIFKRGSAFIIMLMLVFFLLGLGQAYARGLSIDCGCFSVSASSPAEGGVYLLMRIAEDVLMLIGVIIIFFTENKIYKNKIKNINQPNS
jgi:putative oxidoreductase